MGKYIKQGFGFGIGLSLAATLVNLVKFSIIVWADEPKQEESEKVEHESAE